tara:strand:+ start:517 stop:1416 length:900 start_codon:yes stop_codon:yes gene_type:complete
MKKYETIKNSIKGNLRKNVSLKNYNTWRVGGMAEYFFEPFDLNELIFFLENTKDINITFLGNGSNVLIRDGGIKGCVICLKETLKEYEILKDGIQTFQAGFPCMKIAQLTAKSGYGGLEFLCGIPGSLGGALAMNAGCYGGNVWEKVIKVLLINKSGKLIEKSKNDFIIGYRNVNLEDGNFFISATFQLEKNKLNNSQDIIKNYLKDRRSKQPTGQPSCGSVFKNPDNFHAANLIDSLGLKGFKIGGAYVSKKHANFIISEKNTSSEDIEKLINHIQKKVYKEKKVFLETEVKFVGNDQ